MLRAQILALIEASPGISIGELRSRVPGARFRQVHNALHELRKAGAIEAAGYGRYRVTTRTPAPAGRTQTAPMARLMAGR